MIIDKKRKFAVFLNPKTGSTSLLKIFSDIDLEVCDHKHQNLLEAEKEFGSLKSYRKFCFYRDPLERTKSILRQLPHQRDDRYLEIILSHKKQVHWLNFEDIEYFNFSEYEDEVKRLMLNFDISKITTPKLNSSKENILTDTVIENNKSLILDYLQEDYEFLNKHNLKFGAG